MRTIVPVLLLILLPLRGFTAQDSSRPVTIKEIGKTDKAVTGPTRRYQQQLGWLGFILLWILLGGLSALVGFLLHFRTAEAAQLGGGSNLPGPGRHGAPDADHTRSAP